MTDLRPKTLLGWMVLIGAASFLLLGLSGLPTIMRECGKPIAQMPGWCLMLLAPAR